MEDKLLTAKEVAKMIGVSSSWVLRKARCKINRDTAMIPHIRVGGVIRFSPREIEEWLNKHRVRGALKV